MLNAHLNGNGGTKIFWPSTEFRLASNTLYRDDAEVAEYEDGVWWADGKRFASLIFSGPISLHFDNDAEHREVPCECAVIGDGAIRSGPQGERRLARFVEGDRLWYFLEDCTLWPSVLVRAR